MHRNPIIFKEERNSIWFEIDIPYDGTLTFNITPYSNNDDYDWMLYNYDEDLRSKLQNSTANPLRTNNARNDKSINSQTGLMEGYLNPFELIGPGNSFSSPLAVKRGQKLALIIDNIYNGGAGFDLSVNVKPEEEGIIRGIVTSRKSGKPLAAELVLEDDSTGAPISKVVSDAATGKYSMKVPLNIPVNITATNRSYIFSTEDITLTKAENNDLNFRLDTIQTGNKLVLYNIHFAANKDDILPNSRPDLDRLTGFLQNNPLWTVKLIGHTNNNVFAEARYLQQLSFKRAVALKAYLLKNGIAESRLSCIGVGGKMPIVVTKDPVLGMKNLRVEVVLVGR
jgi:outer membrane protein OmpA-like peptidoglycan-associated protein